MKATCMAYNGSTCAAFDSNLFTAQPQTGSSLADLIGVPGPGYRVAGGAFSGTPLGDCGVQALMQRGKA